MDDIFVYCSDAAGGHSQPRWCNHRGHWQWLWFMTFASYITFFRFLCYGQSSQVIWYLAIQRCQPVMDKSCAAADHELKKNWNEKQKQEERNITWDFHRNRNNGGVGNHHDWTKEDSTDFVNSFAISVTTRKNGGNEKEGRSCVYFASCYMFNNIIISWSYLTMTMMQDAVRAFFHRSKMGLFECITIWSRGGIVAVDKKTGKKC